MRGMVMTALVGAMAPTAAAESNLPAELRCALIPEQSTSAQEMVLVGRSGQIYQPQEAGLWVRDSAGGIAGQVASAFADPRHPGGVIAIARRPTPFMRRDSIWYAEPVGVRFPTIAGPCSRAPAFAERNNIYVLDAGRWKRQARTRSRIRALVAASVGDVWALTDDNAIWHFDGRSARQQVSPPGARARKSGAADLERLVAGVPGRAYARAQDGTWYRVGKRSLVRMAMPGLPGPFRQTAAGAGPDGALVVVGWVEAADAAPQFVVLGDVGGQLVASEGPADVDPADPVVLVQGHPASGELLLATRRGTVHIRAKDGSWRRGRVHVKPPSGPIPAAQAAPARAN